MSEELEDNLEQESHSKSCEKCGSRNKVKSIKVQRRYKRKIKVFQVNLCVRCRKSFRGK